MKRYRRWFLTAEVCLYAGFLWSDGLKAYAVGTALKYAGILLCVLYGAFFAPGRIFAVLTLTAAADLFLLVLNRRLELGVALFIAVQALYAVQIGRDNRKTCCVRGSLVLAFWLILRALHMLTPLNLLVGIYFPQLLCNTALAWKTKNPLAWGLTLFLCCDICVGLWNLPMVPDPLRAIAGTGMWAFYLPSQVMIALASGKETPGP